MKIKTKGVEQEEIKAHEFIGVKSHKAKGKRLTTQPVRKISLLEPLNIEDVVVPEAVTEEMPVEPESPPAKKVKAGKIPDPAPEKDPGKEKPDDADASCFR